jgi:tetratricopeptide (TPR) repeat protein
LPESELPDPADWLDLLFRTAREHLDAGEAAERDGRLTVAGRAYDAAREAAEREGSLAAQSEALRRLAVVRHHQNEPEAADWLCRRALERARHLGDPALTAQALNTQGGLLLERGALDEARAAFEEALPLSRDRLQLRGRVEQNLGIVANIRGEWRQAQTHYLNSLAACREAGDKQACAIAFHNLGMISADRREWTQARDYYRQSRELAVEQGDLRLQGFCQLNDAEVLLAQQRYGPAQDEAEAAFRLLFRLGSFIDIAEGWRVLGMVFREIGRWSLAEANLRSAIELAQRSRVVLIEAESRRELGELYRQSLRQEEAIGCLRSAEALFERLAAHHEVADVRRRVAALAAS